MADPTPYSKDYSYTGFQQAQGNNDFPGTQLDNDLERIEQTTNELIEALGGVRKPGGGLVNGIVTLESLAVPTIRYFGQSAMESLRGTSNTLMAVGLGARQFATPLGKEWAVGQRVRVTTLDAQKIMEGDIVSSDAETGIHIFLVDRIEGSGSAAEWSVSVAGIAGKDGDLTPELVVLRDQVTADAAQVASDKTDTAASAASASGSASAAATSENNAASSATAASGSAGTASDAASTATGAAGTATSAASVAVAAAGAAAADADVAAAAASSASGSAGAASSSASEAATSAGAASSAQTAAESARDTALTTYANLSGGALGQVLVKASGVDFAFEWQTFSSMSAATYDPQNIAADAFDVDNHTDGATNKVFTTAEQTKLASVLANADPTGASLAGATDNASIADGDRLGGVLSGGGTLFRITFAALRTRLRLTLDTLYYMIGGTDVSVADGGTGRSSHTAYAVLCGGTTTTAAQQSLASVGSSGQVLTSNGASALPTFQDPASGGQPIPTSSSYPVGTFAMLKKVAAGTLSDGATIAGSSLYSGVIDNDSTPVSPLAGNQTGTWTNRSGLGLDPQTIGYYVRTA